MNKKTIYWTLGLIGVGIVGYFGYKHFIAEKDEKSDATGGTTVSDKGCPEPNTNGCNGWWKKINKKCYCMGKDTNAIPYEVKK
jgi:hypothetical protein